MSSRSVPGPGVPDLVPWAWGINGYASVLSAIVAPMLAMTFGTRAVVLMAAALATPGPSPIRARR